MVSNVANDLPLTNMIPFLCEESTEAEQQDVGAKDIRGTLNSNQIQEHLQIAPTTEIFSVHLESFLCVWTTDVRAWLRKKGVADSDDCLWCRSRNQPTNQAREASMVQV
jgi:hypothetical protein